VAPVAPHLKQRGRNGGQVGGNNQRRMPIGGGVGGGTPTQRQHRKAKRLDVRPRCGVQRNTMRTSEDGAQRKRNDLLQDRDFHLTQELAPHARRFAPAARQALNGI